MTPFGSHQHFKSTSMYGGGTPLLAGPSSNSNNNANGNPASALVSYANPPIPLAPRLTPAFTSHQSHESLGSRHASSSRLNNGGRQVSADAVASTSQTRPPPGPLIHRASLSPATQALNVDTSPPSARFAAYVPRPSRNRYQITSSNMSRGDTVRSGLSGFNSSQDGSWKPLASKMSRVDLKGEDTEEAPAVLFEVLPQFKDDADFPGDVLVRCTGSNFFVHRAILYFASPFFQAVLDGDWKENHPSLHSLSDCDDNENVEDELDREIVEDVRDLEGEDDDQGYDGGLRAALTSPRASFHTANLALDLLDNNEMSSSPKARARANTSHSRDRDFLRLDRSRSLDSMIASKRDSFPDAGGNAGNLQRLATPPHSPHNSNVRNVTPQLEENTSKTAPNQSKKVVAIIDLTEEAASTFQDFLCLVYPNLDLCVTWYNIFELFAFSDKFEVPHLRRACISFLRAALAGRPIDAMALAERHGIEDIYREASRHVLENMPAWESDELEILSKETLLKLERKRTWFLERLLKLGLANPARDYECHAGCPDPPNCARLLHERWRSQYSNAFKYGPPQPSMIWRHLRELESGASSLIPALSACQSSSKAWVQLLFDRMYGLPTHGMTHPKFLSIKLDSDQGPKQRPRPTIDSADISLPL